MASAIERVCRRGIPIIALSRDLVVKELNEAAVALVRSAEGRRCFEVAGRKRSCPRCPAKGALRANKPVGELVHSCMLPGRWLLEAFPVQEKGRRKVVLVFHEASLKRVSSLVDTAEKFRRLVEQGLEAIMSLSEAHGVDAFLATLPEQALRLVRGDGACVVVRNPSTGAFEVASSSEPSIWGLSFKPNELSALGRAVKRGDGVAVFNRKVPPSFPTALREAAEGANLLVARIGALDGFLFLWRRAERFDTTAPLVKFFVRMFDIILRGKAQSQELMEKTAALARELRLAELLHQIDRLVLSPYGRERKRRALVSILGNFGAADICVLLLMEGGKFKAVYAFDREGPIKVEGRAFSLSPLRALLSSGLPTIIPDASRDRMGSALRKALGLEGMRSLLILPIHARQALQGAIIWGSEAPAAFGGESLRHARLVSAQVNLAFETAELQRETRSMFLAAVAGFSTAIDAKSKWTKGHSERVAEISADIGRAMGLKGEELETLVVGALLHDVGKIYLPTEMLEKPGKLTESEWEVMRRHPLLGEEILVSPGEGMEWMRNIKEESMLLVGAFEELGRPMAKFAPIARWHHENWDGTGYPDGLKGKEIPLLARIVRVADAFEAMTADRPYREALPLARAVEEIEEGSGTYFDPEVVEAFVALSPQGKARRPRRPAERVRAQVSD